MVHVIVGYGEVGQGLHEAMNGYGNFDDIFLISDPARGYVYDRTEKVDVVHICIPPIEEFDSVVNHWKKYSDLVIVHSSVAVGTCDRLGVVHSPIRGVHPNMAEGIRTFVKYFGGKDAGKAATIFDNLGIQVRVFAKARTTEALKLWDTTQYGFQIILEKEIHRWCKENDVDFNAVYTMANKDYNEGYRKLGRPEVVRPYLKHYPGLIGGHCVVPNAKLLLGLDFDKEVRKVEPDA